MSFESLKVALYPLDISIKPDENFSLVEQILPSISPATDVLVLPELFSTGFYLKAEAIVSLADVPGGHTEQTLACWARTFGFAIAGSFLAIEDGSVFNRAFFVTPEGNFTFYDKRHLFSPGAEGRILTPGSRAYPVINYRDWKIALSVCYDLRFPVWTRNVGYAYDVMIIPANWPVSRSYAWHHLLIARAIENQAAWVGCNRSGKDRGGIYDGMSQVYDATGHPVGHIDENSKIMYAEILRDVMDKYRKALPTGLDADSFVISGI